LVNRSGRLPQPGRGGEIICRRLEDFFFQFPEDFDVNIVSGKHDSHKGKTFGATAMGRRYGLVKRLAIMGGMGSRLKGRFSDGSGVNGELPGTFLSENVRQRGHEEGIILPEMERYRGGDERGAIFRKRGC